MLTIRILLLLLYFLIASQKWKEREHCRPNCCWRGPQAQKYSDQGQSGAYIANPHPPRGTSLRRNLRAPCRVHTRRRRGWIWGKGQNRPCRPAPDRWLLTAARSPAQRPRSTYEKLLGAAGLRVYKYILHISIYITGYAPAAYPSPSIPPPLPDRL